MRLTYLSVDSLTEGVGASQVLAYVERIGRRDVPVVLHSFEKEAPSEALRERLRNSNVEWRPRPFGRLGSVGGLGRVLTGARLLRGADVVHARSDLAAASALLAGADRWVYDFRSFYVDQKIELGELRAGSVQERVLRGVEKRASLRSSAIVTLTAAAIPVLEALYGTAVTAKAHVITTCVDTSRFSPRPSPDPVPLRLLLAGTINAYYDVPLMIRFFKRLAHRTTAELHVVTPSQTRWDAELDRLATERRAASPDEMDDVVAGCHAGLSVCRDDAGISLKGSMPTKIGEFLASGRPVIVNPGLGDAGALLESHRCGVVLRGGSESDIDGAVDELLALVEDPGVPERCRELALAHFDLSTAVDRLIEIYAGLTRS